MQKRKSFFNNELEQRFSLRKYTIGLCSVCLGFVAIGMGSQTVKADTVNGIEKSSTVQENKVQDADSATAKPNITPTETKKNEVGSVATTAPKTNTTSNGVKANIADSATSTEIKPQETKLAKTAGANNDVVVNTSAQSKSEDSKDIEVKPKESSNVDTNEQKEKDVTLATNSPASETNASSKPVQTVSPEQSADTTDVQPASDQLESAVANSNALENNVSAASASTVLSKQPANADTQPTAITSGVQPFMNLAVVSDNNDLTPKKETVTSRWTIHYVNSADHQQELKAPTVITRQYTRTNTPQSDGTTQYGDWSYVPGSFKLTGTPIVVNGSDNPTKEDNINKDGKNYDVFSIIVQHPDITGYELHNVVSGARLNDYLQNDESNGEIQAPTINSDRYVEYDVAKERSVAVKFVDDQSYDFNTSDHKKQVGQAITLTGHNGDTVNLKLTVPDKYQLADGQQLPTTYTFKNGSGDLTIHLAHKVVQRKATIDVQLALMTGVNIDGIEWMDEALTQSQWEQSGDAIENSSGGPYSYIEELPSIKAGVLAGHVNYDLVNNRVVSFGDDWTTLNLGGQIYQLPNGTDVVNGIMLDFDDSTAKPLKKYYLNNTPNVDPDYINRPWHGYLSVNATNDPESSWNEEYDIGLQAGLVGDEPNALAKANGDRAATAVEMANKTIAFSLATDDYYKFSERDGKLQSKLCIPVVGAYVPYVEKTVTRTINVTTPDSKTTTVKQIATLEKQVDLRPDVHPDWTTGEWTSYDVPTIPGYTASQSQIAKTAVTGTTKDQTVNITYTANPQASTVVYQTEDGTPIHTTTVNGKTGQTVKVSNEVPVGWHVVNGTVPSEITFGPNGTPKIVVTIAHSHATVTSDAPKTTGDKLPDNPNKAYPTGVGETDLNKTVTRTIKVTTPDEQTKTITQTAKLTRTADVDEVTGEVKYSDWSTGQWDKYDVPTVPGYTASQPNIADQTVTNTTKDATVTITYTANEHQISVEYVDTATGNVVKTDHMSGKTGQTVPITPHIPDGWELLSGQSVPSEVTLGADGAPATVIKVQPQERSVAVKFVDDQSYERQVGQAITLTGRDGETVDLHLTVPDKYQLADGQQLPTTYTFAAYNGDVTIHLVHKVVQREAAVDVQVGFMTLVDPDDEDDPAIVVTQNQWTKLDDEIKKHALVNDLEEVDPTVGVVGTLTGHVNYDLVDNKVVSFADDWTSLNLGGQTYQMPNGTEVVNGVMLNNSIVWGKKLKELFLKGSPDADPDYATYSWHGYLSVNKSHIPSDLLVGNESNALAKATDDRAATAIEMPNKPIDLSSLQDVMGGGLSDFNEQDGQLRAKAIVPVDGMYIPYVEKTATRTINVTTPDGKTTAVKQTATLAKQVDFADDVHPDWTTSEWTSYDVPVIPGYTASQSQVAKETVTGTTEDQTVNITYTANPQTSTVVYQTEDGTPVHTTTVNGRTGQTVKVPNEVPVGWHVVNGNVPSEITFAPNGTPQTVVTIAHSHVTVTPDTPKTISDKLPDNPDKTYPTGVSETDLNKTVTRTIKVTTPDGQNKTIAQTAKLTRTADVDEVTGEVKYGDWTTGEWASYDVSTVPGYTASQNEVPSMHVTSETKPSVVIIRYKAQDHTVTYHFVDENGKQQTEPDGTTLIADETVGGKTDDTVNTPKLPDGWVLDGDTLGSTVKVPSADKTINVKIKHGQVTVTHDNPVHNGEKIPGTINKTYGDGLTKDDLNQQGTRTIVFNFPKTYSLDDAKKVLGNGDKYTQVTYDKARDTAIVIQTIHFTRDAVVDTVTGKVVEYKGAKEFTNSKTGEKSLWNSDPVSGSYAAVKIPKVSGYKSKLEHVKDQTQVTRRGLNFARYYMVNFMALPSKPGSNVPSEPAKTPGTNFDDATHVDKPGEADNKGQDQGNKGQNQDNKGQDQGGQKTDDHKGQTPSGNTDNTQKSTETKPSNNDQKPVDNPNADNTKSDEDVNSTDYKFDGKKSGNDLDTKSSSKKSTKTVVNTTKKTALNGNDKGVTNMVTTVSTTGKASDSVAPKGNIANADNGEVAGVRTVQAATVNGSANGAKDLPHTGEKQGMIASILGALASGLGILELAGAKHKKKED